MANYSRLPGAVPLMSISSGEVEHTETYLDSHFEVKAPPEATHEDVKEQFKAVIGVMPFMEPNVKSLDDLFQFVTVRKPIDCCDVCCGAICCATIIGCCYVCSSNILINQGQLGFSINNGRPELLLPGRHLLMSPLNQYKGTFSRGDDLIRVEPITIVRVQEGSVGLALNGAAPEVLLPGLHIRNNAAFKFERTVGIDEELIQFYTIKLLTVRSGGVRVCFANGKVQVFHEGRYAINSGTFNIGGRINTQQTNIRFDKHPVLLDGGINLLVEGLLTYQVTDVERLIHELGDTNLERTIKDITKAELARVFAGLHLEQISSASNNQPLSDEKQLQQLANANATGDDVSSMLGKGQGMHHGSPESAEGETRMWICGQVIKAISPIVTAWGVKIKNFQLESTNIADYKYASEYEAASLAMAKAKADLRARHATNKIVLATAEVKAQSLRIEAEGRKNAAIIEAEGVAEARRIDAKARNEAAKMMQNPFAKEFAMNGQQVEFARNLKANVLTVVPESALGASIIGNGMLSGK